MKKLIIASVIALSLTTAKAQFNVSLGPVAGFGHSWISGGGENKYKPSGNFGFQAFYSPTEHLGIEGDVLYSIEGGTKTVGNVDYTTRLNYLRIPIKAVYFFNNYGDRFRPKVSLGPSLGLLLGAKNQFGTVETDAKSDYKTLDFGVLANAGAHFRLVANTWLTLDLNYYHGLSDVSELQSQTNKNRNLFLNAGLAFGIARHRDRR